MTRKDLVINSVRFHWRLHVTVALGTAVACAILAGSLIVGDSVRATLGALSGERLGEFSISLAVERFFRTEIASDLASSSNYPTTAVAPVAVLLADGAVAVDVDGTRGARAGEVSVVGVDDQFFRSGFPKFSVVPPGLGQVVLNQTLASELHVDSGATILLSVRTLGAAPIESFLGESAESSRLLRLEVAHVLPDRGPGLFSLRHTQAAPRLAYVGQQELARAMAVPGRSNVILVASAAHGESETALLAELRDTLIASLELDDIALRLRRDETRGFLSLESRRMVVSDATLARAREACEALGWRSTAVLTHLAEAIAIGDREIPFSTMSALDAAQSPPLGPLALTSGVLLESSLKEGEILLNEWAARDLGLDPKTAEGIDVRVRYYVPRVEDRVRTAEANFRLRGVVALDGIAADPHLTPEFPGITDAKVTSIRNWDPPFEMDLDRVRDVDDEYWRDYKATPKAFVSEADGQRYFRGRFGGASSLRIVPPGTSTQLATAAADFERHILEHTTLVADLGFVWTPVRSEGAEASASPTDFGMLFVSFSFFLIVSAAILVSLLFGLQMDGRAREMGVYLASGFGLRSLRRLYLVEALIVAGVGGLIGLLAAVAYAALLLHGLETWWWEAVRVPFLVLTIAPLKLAIGYLVAEFIVAATIVVSVRRLGRTPVPALLAGTSRVDDSRKGVERARRSVIVFLASSVLTVLIAAVSFFVEERARVGLFFGVGTLSLVALVSAISVWLRRSTRERANLPATASLSELGCRNARRAPARSLLTVALVSSATFILVAVASMQHDARQDSVELHSGNGGFALAATSEVPLVLRVDTDDGRRELGLDMLRVPTADGSRREPNWQALKGYYFRVRAGDDTSCLNLYAPRNPRVLGTPASLVERGGFVFKSHLAETDAEAANPWLLLDRRFEDGAIPAIGDANSTTWILKKGLGDDVPAKDDSGRDVKLRIVATLSGSLFQGELLVAESRFMEAFPSLEGYRFFLFEGPGQSDELTDIEQGLEMGLETIGFDVVRSTSLIASFLAVENTYLSTFLMLGGLGLLLGTLGLGVVLVRGVLERRGELALLRALGFRKARIAMLILAEDVLLLGLSVGGGGLAAFLAVLPRFWDSSSVVPWASIASLLAFVVFAGLLSGLLAVITAVRVPILRSLRND
jgi:putative ABC transport system permease protein